MSVSLQSLNGNSDFSQLFAQPILDARASRVFWFCVAFILCVSIYDSYLVGVYRDSILIDERNPVCEFLIRLDPQHLSWFLVGKLLGNVLVVGSLVALLRSGFRRTLTVAKSVAGFQLLLLVYLLFADCMTGFLSFDGLVSNHSFEFQQSLHSAVIHLGVFVPLLCGYFVARRKISRVLANVGR